MLIFIFICYQRNAHQNHGEIAPYTFCNDYFYKASFGENTENLEPLYTIKNIRWQSPTVPTLKTAWKLLKKNVNWTI